MGGFAFDTQDPISVFGDETRFVLTPDGVSLIMKHFPHLIPDISARSLQDRSKAGGMAKALLVVQVLYFCVSCALRKVEGLPLSLLEISTLAHALCAILTYAVWWTKPLNILEPTPIGTTSDGQRSDVRHLAAWLLMRTSMFAELPGGIFTQVCRSEEQSLVISDVPTSETDVQVVGKQDSIEAMVNQTLQVDGLFYTLHPAAESRWLLRAVYGRASEWPWYATHAATSTTQAEISPRDLARWRLAAGIKGMSGSDPDEYQSLVQLGTDFSMTLCLGFDSVSLFFGAPLAFALCAAAYGTPHLLGWNTRLATHTQETLWRVASVVLPASGCLYFLVLIPFVFLKWVLGRDLDAKVKNNMLFGYLPFVFLSYLLASGFLVVSSIQQLFILPAGVFQQPSVSNFWPHIS